MQWIWYGYWSLLRNMDKVKRIGISMGLLSVIIMIFLKVTYPLWRRFLLFLEKKIVCVYMWIREDVWYGFRIRRMKDEERIERLTQKRNNSVQRLWEKYQNLERQREAIKEHRKKLSLLWGIVVYVLLFVLVSMPESLQLGDIKIKNSIAVEYNRIEQRTFEQLTIYEKRREVEKKKNQEPMEPVMDTYLRLTEKGVGGSNIRQMPDKNSEVVTVIEGDIQFIQLELSSEGDWVKIRLGDGTEGWIHSSLVEPVEE